MKRLELFPISTKIENDGLTIAGHNLETLARDHGTPLYLYDRATMDNAVGTYKSALASLYPGPASITYAGKAFLNLAIAQWTQSHNLLIDCTGEGEIAIATAGSVPRDRILVHGVNKSRADLEAAIQQTGTIVVDNLNELDGITKLFPNANSLISNLWLRLQPGIAVDTHHAHTQTGQHDSKFGMTPEEIKEAAAFCKEHHLPLNGIHFHQGSNFRDTRPLKIAVELGLDLALEIGLNGDWHFSPGGGWGVAYHEDELPHPDPNEYVRAVAETLISRCKTHRLALPHLHLEPGRSIIARAGVAIYKVGAVKRRGAKVWLLTDGGMTDNPRHALYGTGYSCLPVEGIGRKNSERVSIAGPYCESGDIVIEDLLMPKIEAGELIAIPVSGAYHLSMSSNYNGSRRPEVLWLEDKKVKVITRRETIEDLLHRDTGL
jgi:diaminopimelate decarboxylase